MRLTMQTDYALRMLIQLGVHNDRLVTVSETARAYQVSKNHMMKVAHRLCLEGFVKTVRGQWRRSAAGEATFRNQYRRRRA
jgi:Rrf2 family nitric oxide-sensitive transcriptional repressor